MSMKSIKNTLVLLLSLLLVSSSFSQITKKIQLVDFKTLSLEGASNFTLFQSDKNMLEVIIDDEEVMDYIEITNSNQWLVINTTSKNKNISKICSKLNFKIYFKNIEDISFDGVGRLTCWNQLNTKSLKVVLKGTGNVDLDVYCVDFEGSMKGTGLLTVKGETTNAELFVAGVGGLESAHLKAQNTNITLNGVGYAEVYASKSLKAKLNGLGNIKYAGDPIDKNFTKNGLGSIKKLEN